MSRVTYVIRVEMDANAAPSYANEAVRDALNCMSITHPIANVRFMPGGDDHLQVNVRAIKQDRIQGDRDELVRKQAEAWEALMVFMDDRRTSWALWPGKDGTEKMLNCLDSWFQAASFTLRRGDPVQDVKDAAAAASRNADAMAFAFDMKTYKFRIDVHKAEIDELRARLALLENRLDNAPRF